MQQQRGFTLIELVVVIILLGILAAVAYPKFINFGSDARKAALEGFQGALQSANAMSAAKFSLSGFDSGIKTQSSGSTVNGIPVNEKGYIQASQAAIKLALQLTDGEWGFESVASGRETQVMIYPKGLTDYASCRIEYTVRSTGEPEYDLKTSDCG